MYGVKTGGFASAAEAACYFEGVAAGFVCFAHWRDGTQYVGSTGMTLAEANDQLEDHRRQVMLGLGGAEARDYHKGSGKDASDYGVNGDYEPLADGVSLREMVATVIDGEEYPAVYNGCIAEALNGAFAPSHEPAEPEKPKKETKAQKKAREQAEAQALEAAKPKDDGENTPIVPAH